MRACPGCGKAEERRTVDGREVINLDPTTGRCVECLVAYWRQHLEAKDWQKKAAGDTT